MPSQDRTHPTILDKIQAKTILLLMPKSVTPNNVTGFRFAMIPFVIYFLVAGEFQWGIGLFIIAALSDAVDGAMARTRNQVTDWGKMYDPVADKLLIGSVVAIIVSKYIGHAVAFAIIALELIIVATAFYRRKYRGVPIQARWPGKIKMVLQSIGVFLLLMYMIQNTQQLLDISRYTLYGAIFFAVVSLIFYSI